MLVKYGAIFASWQTRNGKKATPYSHEMLVKVCVEYGVSEENEDSDEIIIGNATSL